MKNMIESSSPKCSRNYPSTINILLIFSILSSPSAKAVNTTPLFIFTTKSPPALQVNDLITNLLPTTTTTPYVPQFIDPDFNRCLPINTSSPTLQINSTENRNGIVIRASCTPPYYINSRINTTSSADLFRCNDGLWKPVSPRCLVDNTREGNKVGIIVACVIGIIIALALILGAVFLFIKMGKHKEILKQKQEEIQTKMFRINDFVLSNNEDFIGMPVVGVQSRSCDLRGVPLENLDDGLDISSIGSSPPPQQEEDTLHLY